MVKVVKFGGSSLSNGQQFEKVKKIIEADKSRRIVIVSAPGKRNSGDNKITDLLYLCNAHLKYDVSFDGIFEKIQQRYVDIRNECGLNTDIEKLLSDIKAKMKKGMSVDYLVSRGEYLNAVLMADYLGFEFLDAKDWIAFRYDKSVDIAKSEENLRNIYDEGRKIVIPGFYGADPNGEVVTFSRGGSDVTGAIAAAAVDADVYENWTDVQGILMADPRIVDNPQTIEKVTYNELRELSYMGAAVLHEDTVFPVREKNIPVNIRDTNNPKHPGTIIRESFQEDTLTESERFITGITGKKNYTIVNIYKNSSDGVNTLKKALDVCEQFGVTVEQIPWGIDSFSIVMTDSSIDGKIYQLIGALDEACKPDNIGFTDGISLIAIVGRHMAYSAGISGKIFAALGDNKINIRTIEQGSDEINIIVGVATTDFEKAIQVLYNSFAKHK
ncbi:MAG: aspartate kinase [Eubacteriales bacterium]|nr:aspartate kinase [Eubacteriales bacterium]